MKYKPTVIGITGSVGKSSTKEAIAHVLSSVYDVRKTEGNYNNEIGIPLTIIGARSGGHSLWGWLCVFGRWCIAILFPVRYPKILVLEMGIDRPKDMEYLLSFIPIDVAVVTQVSLSHVAFFGSIQAIAKEKGKLPLAVPAQGHVILNYDDPRVRKMAEKTKAQVMTYGFDDGAMVHVDNLLFHRDIRNIDGFSFKLNYAGKSIPVRLPLIVGRHHISAVLGAVGCGIVMKMNLVEIAQALEAFAPLPGRLQLLSGREGSSLLDDTYNASPASVTAALETMKELMAPRRVVILGDMLELGGDAENEHRALAEKIIAGDVHVAILVGQHMHFLFEELLNRGFSRKQVFWFPDVFSAFDVACGFLRMGDLVLIKGSRGMRMEKMTEILLADPASARNVLCCQSPEWRDKPFAPPEEWTEKI